MNTKWEAFCKAAEKADVKPPDDPNLVDTLKSVFFFSDFVATSCIRNPEMLAEMVANGDLEKQYSVDEYDTRLKESLSKIAETIKRDKSQNLDSTIKHHLRELRQHEMVRIAFRDLSGFAGLSDTMTELSAFADRCLKWSLSVLFQHQCEKFGTPKKSDGSIQQLVIIGMGKLGARELNFSSDIDLIFAYPDTGIVSGRPKSVSSEEFFVRLCRKLVNVISETTLDGLVFRIDLDLRPFGKSGPIVMSFDAMEDYYQRQGREWERYAWIKARVVADGNGEGARFLKKMKPFVYRRYLDFATFESFRDMKRRIEVEVKRKGMTNNIKLGPGGIREIEFFGQIFQLIRGGILPALQECRIQKVLQILFWEGHIDEKVCEGLTSAYKFLRKTEHRLQEFADQQTHSLPLHAEGRKRLAASMGFDEWKPFSFQLKKHMEYVHRHFMILLGAKDTDDQADGKNKNEKRLESIGLDPIEDEKTGKILSDAGFDAPEEVMRLLYHLQSAPATKALSAEGRKRLDRLVPQILKAVVSSDHPVLALGRIIELIKTIERRTNYLALLLENPTALAYLVKFANASSWIINFFSRHPLLLDELLDPRALYAPPKKSELEKEIRHRLEQISPFDIEFQMEELRIFKQINVLRVAASDIAGVLPLLKVSDHLTNIAEAVIHEVLELSWNHLTQKHGKPKCVLDGKKCARGFAVIAYGKLGGIELGYGSDLDLIFLHAGEKGATTDGNQPVDNAQFFARLGQRVLHILSSHTPTGILYEIDMRLRPSGGSGLLVSHIQAFEKYQAKSAWTWEHQALIKARPIAGDIRLKSRFEQIREKVLARRRVKGVLQKRIAGMRERMRKELFRHEAGVFDLKQGAGGIVDIEFLVQYLMLLRSNEHKKLIKWTDNVRIIRALFETGIIDDYTAHVLRHAYLVYRSLGHQLSLQEKPAKISEDDFLDLREKIKEIWDFFIKGTDHR